jgi:hypothetical protein
MTTIKIVPEMYLKFHEGLFYTAPFLYHLRGHHAN